MTHAIRMLFIGCVSIIVLACTASPNSESTGEYLDSTTTTAKVKTTLIDELGASGFSVKVKTYKDEVQLSGFVDTLRVKQRAGSITAGVEGVRSVRNDIIVKTR